MFHQFQTLIHSKGLMKTVTDGDCFFDTIHKITGLYTKRTWRQVLGKQLWKKKVFTQKQYDHYIYTHEWADYPTVYEAVRYLQRPFCVVQREYPNAVMLIRPNVEWSPNVLYLVYDSGNHFTSFLHPCTPPELVDRLKTMERVDMREEVEGLIVTHGKLEDLLEPAMDHFMRKYEERNGRQSSRSQVLRRTKTLPNARSSRKTRKRV